jgi:putative colanic acid biosynthesis UDP-glucose lipid carrier transferase
MSKKSRNIDAETYSLYSMKPSNNMSLVWDTGSVLSEPKRNPLADKLLAASSLAQREYLRKRAFDVVFSALIAALLLSWLIPLIACIIKFESKGPILFRQLRTGKDGKSFYCLKFRSMYLNDEADAKQASKGDRRITKVGAFLRRTSLDELPQFLNVLAGDMSVVGPRPHMIQHTEQYSKVIHNFMERHSTKPGITGLAQVTGYRGETKEMETMAKRVEADIHYLHNWTILLDIKIVMATVVQAVKGDQDVF